MAAIVGLFMRWRFHAMQRGWKRGGRLYRNRARHCQSRPGDGHSGWRTTQGRRLAAGRLAGNLTLPLPRPLGTVRIRIREVLSGVDPSQQEIEIVTGVAGGDCGYPF
jgi:hypothetical protein